MDYTIGYAGGLILIILGLLINRHIIGGVGYNFFSPMVIGYAAYILSPGYEWTGLIILSTIGGRIITKAITHYINFSLYPRYVIYTMISLLLFVINGLMYIQSYNLEQLPVESSQHLVLLFLITVAMGVKVYAGGRSIISLLRRGHVVWFFVLSFIIYIGISQEYIRLYFMTHISSIIILGAITLLIGSYRGLQIKEMIRFRKLIRAKITGKRKRN